MFFNHIKNILKRMLNKKKILLGAGSAVILILVIAVFLITAMNKNEHKAALADNAIDMEPTGEALPLVPVSDTEEKANGEAAPKPSAGTAVTPAEGSAAVSQAPSADENQEEHLAFYDEFPMYNSSWDYYKGFVLSEEWIDGKACYQLLNKNKDVRVLVDSSMENAEIFHNGKSMKIKMSLFLSGTSSYSTMDVLDLTGDGKDELVICYSSGGTGVKQVLCDIISLDEMTKYQLEDFLYPLSASVTVEPVEADENHVITCKVTDNKGNIAYGTVAGPTSDLSRYSYRASDFSPYYSMEVDYEKRRLKVSTNIVMDAYSTCHLGCISSYLVYNEKKGCFELSGDCSVELFEKTAYTKDQKKDSSGLSDQIAQMKLKDKNASLTKDQKKPLQEIIKSDPAYAYYYVDIITEDFDQNGKQDSFFVFTKEDPSTLEDFSYCADIWFGNEKGVKRMAEWQNIAPETYKSLQFAGKMYFRYDNQYVTDHTTVLLGVADGKCAVSFKASGNAAFEDGENDFTVYIGSYDMLYDKEMELTLGHTWKNYFYYADADGFHEYGAKEIDKKQFLKYDKADAILKLLQEKYDKKGQPVTFSFLLRNNGLLHINISVNTKDSINYYYETYQLTQNNTLAPCDNGDGSYVTAMNEEIAVY